MEVFFRNLKENSEEGFFLRTFKNSAFIQENNRNIWKNITHLIELGMLGAINTCWCQESEICLKVFLRSNLLILMICVLIIQREKIYLSVKLKRYICRRV